MHFQKWTPDEDARIIALRARKFEWKQIGFMLGRSIKSCKQRLYYLRKDKKDRGYIPSEHRTESGPRSSDPNLLRAKELREARYAARDRRDHASLSRGIVTPVFFGDPPPGYSALDKRRA